MTLERTYTVPLRRAFNKVSRNRRTPRAVKAVRTFLAKHMKSDEIKLGQHLNDRLWQAGIRNPPARVRVTAVKDDDGVVRAELEGRTYTETVRPAEATGEPEGLKEKLQAAMGGDSVDEEPEEEPEKETEK